MTAVGVELKAVSKRYGDSADGVRALDGVDLTFGPGEFVSLEGPSGCGKTTLLNLVGLLDQPTSGEVLFDGESVGRMRERARARRRLTAVGFIFQRFYLLPTLTSRENVEVPMRARGVGRSARRERASELLESVGLASRADAYPHQLSGGEEQRVAIARSLANEPGLLLADEPTGELDSASAQTVLETIESLQAQRGTTLVVVTHNPTVAARARRHVTMRDGRVVGDVRGA